MDAVFIGHVKALGPKLERLLALVPVKPAATAAEENKGVM